MSGSFLPHLEVLPEQQRRIWSGLRPMASLGFVLYGGTAVALRHGHRQSVDFDFFSERPLDKTAARALLEPLGPFVTIQDRANTLSVSLRPGSAAGEPVSLSFFGGIGFGRVGEPDMTEDGVLQVASLLDLAATKVAVITQRAEAKDYRDLAAMLRAGTNLTVALGAARAIYGADFQPSESLRAMTYFGDGNLSSLSHDDQSALVHAAAAVRHVPQVPILSKVLGKADAQRHDAPRAHPNHQRPDPHRPSQVPPKDWDRDR